MAWAGHVFLEIKGRSQEELMKDGGHVVMATVVVAVGLAFAGWFAGTGFCDARMADRFVTVKGVAERKVKADVALWSLRFVATGNDLAKVQAKIARDEETVRAFLADAGIARDAISLRNLEVTDVLAQLYRSGLVDSRFIVAQTLVVRTQDMARVATASQQVAKLAEAGVVLNNEMGPGDGPTYAFTRLNDFKPEMIAEASRNARAGAEQFARDSGSRVRAIRPASQRLFQILPWDDTSDATEAQQPDKLLHVVSTIDYFLVD